MDRRWTDIKSQPEALPEGIGERFSGKTMEDSSLKSLRCPDDGAASEGLKELKFIASEDPEVVLGVLSYWLGEAGATGTAKE